MGMVKFETLRNSLIEHNSQLVLLDKDVAKLYEIEPKKLRQQLKRNIEKFPQDYAYQLNEKELDIMVSQNVTPSKVANSGCEANFPRKKLLERAYEVVGIDNINDYSMRRF